MDIPDATIVIKSFLRPLALNALVVSIRRTYPNIRIHVADDGDMSELPPNIDEFYRLPFDSGLSKGRNFLVDTVETCYTVLLDDDTVFTENSRLDYAIRVLSEFKSIDIVAGHYLPHHFYGKHTIEDGILIRDMHLASAVVDGFPIFDFVPNFFVARTNALKKVRWDEELKIQEHMDYFWRARGILKCTYLPYFSSINSNAREEGEYKKYRERTTHFQALQARKIGVTNIISRKNDKNYRDQDLHPLAYRPQSS